MFHRRCRSMTGKPTTASRDSAADGPRACVEHDRELGAVAEEPLAQPHAKLLALVRAERRDVITRWPLLLEERTPVVVERREARSNRERLLRHIFETMLAPERLELSSAAERHVLLVTRVHGGVERDGLVPEDAQHLHPVVIVPDGARDGAAAARDTNHLAQRFRSIGNEVEDEERKRPIEASVRKPKQLRISNLE